MDRRNRLTRRSAIAGSLASLLAATGKPRAEAKAELVAASGGGAGSDFLVLEPDSERFFALTRGFNRRWAAPNCAKIFLPLNEAGVEEALTQAVAFGPGRFRARGGGHCYEDFVFSDDTQALIDMSLLDAVGQDPQSGFFFAESGANIGQLYGRLHSRYGVTLPAGSCYSVGLGGHICGGGFGMLSRQFGLTVDWLTGLHVVTVSRNGGAALNRAGRESRAASPQSDLFWAHTGGGGGNFGLITRYEFATLPAAPQRAELLVFSWPWNDIKRYGGVAYLARIIACFEDLTRTLGPSFFALRLPHEAAGAVDLVAQSVYDGTARSPASSPFVRELTARLRRFGVCECAGAPTCPVLGHPINLPCPLPYQDLSWREAVEAYGGSGPSQKGKYKSAYMRGGFSADAIATIYRHLTAVPQGRDGQPIASSEMAQSLLQVDSYGGRVNEVSPQATAVWQRSSILKLQYQTYWQAEDNGPDEDDPHIAWIRGFYRDVYASYGGVPDPDKDPAHNVDGCYVNYCDADLNDYGREAALRLYYGGNLPRLKQTKREWDPGNYFQHRQSIPPG